MTREEIQKAVLDIPNSNILIMAGTGIGKTFCALSKIDKIKPKGKILIVIPRLVLIQNWKDEFKKWNYEQYLKQTEFVTYVSLPKYMGKSYDIVVYDECFRGDTEILTNSGYKQFQNLTEEDLVAQWNNGKIEFVKPLRLIKRWHSDKICKLHIKRNRYLYVTPNHNQPYYNTRTDKIVTTTIEQLNKNVCYKYITTGNGTGNNNLLTNLEKIYIAIQADGTLQRHQKNESVYSIQLTKDRKKERFEALIEHSVGFTEIKVKRPNTKRWMCKLPKGNAKLLSTHFNVVMGYDRANDFINEIVQWDGSKITGQLYYSSKIKENSDFVAAVAVQAGYQVFQSIEKDNRQDNYSDIHRVYMKRPQYFYGDTSLSSLKKEFIDYNDYVYCVEVPSHKIVIRSEGVTLISGNCHHITPRCQEAIPYINSKFNILLSATIKRTLKPQLYKLFPNLYTFEVSLKTAIDNGILPEPRIVLIPLNLETVKPTEVLCYGEKKPKQYDSTYENWLKNKWYYLKTKPNYGVRVHCTQQQYYKEICSFIENCTNRLRNGLVPAIQRPMVEQVRKRKGKERLSWLAEIKSDYVNSLLQKLDSNRTLTFCHNIEQSERLGTYSINSKNKHSKEYLNDFNNRKIQHITCIDMLNEGINLSECELLIFAVYNVSEIMRIQKVGRGLRHKKPIFIMPYYKDTKEEQIVNDMIADYDKSLVTVVTNPLKINEYINQ